jgi:hypothetical protein
VRRNLPDNLLHAALRMLVFPRLFSFCFRAGLTSFVVGSDTELAHAFHAAADVFLSGITLGVSTARSLTYSETRFIADLRSDSATIL